MYKLIIVNILLNASVVIISWFVVIGSRPPIGTQPPITTDEIKSYSLTVGVGSTVINSFMTVLISMSNLSKQEKTSQNLEKVKRVLDKRIPAHGDLYAAAINYYRTLAPLETGNFNFSKLEKAELLMKKTEGLTVYVSDQYAKQWQDFWHHARYIKEYIHNNISDPEQRKIYWKDNVKEIGERIHQLQNSAREQFS